MGERIYLLQGSKIVSFICKKVVSIMEKTSNRYRSPLKKSIFLSFYSKNGYQISKNLYIDTFYIAWYYFICLEMYCKEKFS